MLFFLLLLGCVTVLLWGVPQYRRSRNRNLIALRASGTGCLSLVLLLVVGFLLLLILRLPLSILPLFLIAFCTLPLIAGVFAAFLAVKISRRAGLEGPPPSVRAILCYFLLGLIGVTIWVGGRCLEMRRVKEVWAVEYAVPTAGIRKIAVCQRLLNPVFERYERTLKVVGADGSTRTLAFPPGRMDGRRVVNLYGLAKVPDLLQPLFLFADGVSALASYLTRASDDFVEVRFASREFRDRVFASSDEFIGRINDALSSEQKGCGFRVGGYSVSTSVLRLYKKKI